MICWWLFSIFAEFLCIGWW